MKKRALFLGLALVLSGCKGPEGKMGPTGPQGDPGTGMTVYTKTLRNGCEPSSVYAGNMMNRLSSANPTTNYQNDGNLRLNNTSTDVSKIILRFTLDGWIPANATVTGAVLELVTATTTNVVSTCAAGLHDMSIAGMVDGVTKCVWLFNATWNDYSTAVWSNCGGPGPITAGFNYNAAPMDTVSISSTVNGTNTRVAWNITPAVVQKWLEEPTKNNGFVITSETEGSDPAGNLVFSAPNDVNADSRPNLLVTYYIP